MTDADNEAHADLTVDDLLFDGEVLDAEVHQVITGAAIRRTIDGAPTLSIKTYDSQGILLKSGLFSKRLTAQLDQRSFELAAVSKSGKALDLTLEDLVVAELRRHKTPRKAEKHTVTRLQFARLLLEETPWIPLIVNPTAKAEVTNVELARGTPAAEGTEAQEEDTWTCLKRIFAEIGWRCYVDAGGVNVGPDSAYLDRGAVMTLSEDRDDVDYINFNWDIGKAIATADLTMRAKRWAAPPGTPVKLENLGPADGLWLVSSIERSLFSPNATVQLKAPEPALPEPPDPDDVLEGEDFLDGDGRSISGNVGGKGGYRWPTSGRVTSNFGQRNGKKHEGVDIGAATGTAVVAARDGTVTTAGNSGGYGNAVYVTHATGNSTRYGHLSKILCRRGQKVTAGQKIGEVGSTGNSTGPHLHFEIRIDNKAVNPLNFF